MSEELAELAVSLCREVQSHVLRRIPLTGDAIPQITGPGGVWRLRMSESRGTMATCITAPSKERFWSFKAMVHHLQFTMSDVDLSMFDTDEVLDHGGEMDGEESEGLEDKDQARQKLAALLIQRVVRMHASLQNQRRLKELRESIAKLEKSSRAQRMAQTHVCDQETRLRAAHEDLLVAKVTDGLWTVDEPTSLLSLLTHETHLTRTTLCVHATNAMRHHPETSLEYVCAKGVTREKHHPIVLGVLPLPKGMRRVSLLGETFFVKAETYVTPKHHATLLKEFKDKWAKHVQKILRNRPMVAYDLFKDAGRTTYLGSIVVSKFLTRHHRILTPVVSIESIVSVKKKKGHGTFMFDLVKQLLYTDAHVHEGIVFAQCLPIPFWNHLLDVSTMARTLVFQMSLLYSSYKMEEDCIMRAKHFFQYDDASSDDEKMQKKKRQRSPCMAHRTH